MVSIGVDIGTTTICACVLDTNTGEVLKPGRKTRFHCSTQPQNKDSKRQRNRKHDFSYIKRDYNKL